MSAFALGKSGSQAFDLTILFYAGALLVNRVCQTHVTHTYTAISLSTIAGWVTQEYTQPGTAIEKPAVAGGGKNPLPVLRSSTCRPGRLLSSSAMTQQFF